MQVFHGEETRTTLHLVEDEAPEERKGPRLALWRAERRQTLRLEWDIQEGEDQRHALVRVEVGLLQPACAVADNARPLGGGSSDSVHQHRRLGLAERDLPPWLGPYMLVY